MEILGSLVGWEILNQEASYQLQYSIIDCHHVYCQTHGEPTMLCSCACMCLGSAASVEYMKGPLFDRGIPDALYYRFHLEANVSVCHAVGKRVAARRLPQNVRSSLQEGGVVHLVRWSPARQAHVAMHHEQAVAGKGGCTYLSDVVPAPLL